MTGTNEFPLLDLPRELVLEILTMLPLWVLLILTHCPEFRALAYQILRGRPIALFGGWLLPPEDTLTMMRESRTILSGSSALATVSPSHWEPEALDFYCPINEFEAVRDWFVLRGYVVVNDTPTATIVRELHRDDWVLGPGEEDQYWDLPRVRYDCNSGVKRVMGLTKGGGCGERKINIVQSQSDSALVPLGFFDSTLLMNFVTGDGAVCLYPKLLQKDAGMLNYQLNPPLREVTADTLRSLLMYQDRGYRFMAGEAPFVDTGRRRWNDRYSVSMPFDAHYPVTVFPAVDWNTGHRVYKARGYYDVEPVVGVAQDAETVYYENHLRKARLLLDVPDDEMEGEGSEVLDDFTGSGDEGSP